VMADCHQSLAATAWRTISLHDSLFSYTSMLARKFLIFFHPSEIPNNSNIYYSAQFSAVLSWCQLSFWWIGLPAVGGMVLAVKLWSRTWPLFAFLACGLLPVVLFYNLSRFRTPLVPILAPFAAYATVTVVEELRGARLRALVVIVLAAVAMGGAALRAAPPAAPLIRAADYSLGTHLWVELSEEALEGGDRKRALAILERALEVEPNADVANNAIARSFARLHLICSTLAQGAGDTTGAVRHLERAMALEGRVGHPLPRTYETPGFP